MFVHIVCRIRTSFFSGNLLLKESFEYSGLGDWQKYVEINKKFIRPYDIDNLVGDASKAEKDLGWKPEMSYDDLIKMMVDSDMKSFHKEQKLKELFPF